MRNRWFRLYDEVADDPKVQSLSHEDFKHWINLLCIANRFNGRINSIEILAFGLRIPVSDADRLVDRLSIAGLIDRAKGGPNGWAIAPHAWGQRQYKSDTSTERVKRFRNAQRAVSETPSEAETEADTEVRDSSLRSESCPPASPSNVTATESSPIRTKPDTELRARFDEFWSLYPRQVKRTRALEVWLREIRLEVVPDVIQAALRYAALREGEPERYTELAANWLHGGRWKDSLTDTKPKPDPPGGGNGRPTLSDRNAESRRGFLDTFGLGPAAAGSGPGRRGNQLLGPADTTVDRRVCPDDVVVGAGLATDPD